MLLAAASQPDIAKRIDDTLELIEYENPQLRNVLPGAYASAPLSSELMGSLVETTPVRDGDGASRARLGPPSPQRNRDRRGPK